MNKFKVGDKVYCPYYGTDVFEVQANEWNEDLDKYPLSVGAKSYTVEGMVFTNSQLQSLFHATPENHELLEKLYGAEFEKPPVKPTSKEIIEAMLERGDKAVLCWVHDLDEYPSESNSVFTLVKDIIEGRYISVTGITWKYATPFDPRTGQPITELPEPTRRMATLTVPHYNS